MTRVGRLAVFGVGATAMIVCLLFALHGLPAFGDYHGTYGRLLNQTATTQRGTSNVVTAIVFDYRGFDTLGEEFILFSSVMGVVFILRGPIAIKEQGFLDVESMDALRVVGVLTVPIALITGLWLVAYGYVTPGGGFQGGVAIAAAVVLVWLATSYRHYQQLTPSTVVDAMEGFGAAAYVAVGVIGLGLGGAFLANFWPIGTAGTLGSGGSIGLLNWASALEVAAANILLFREFLQEYGQTFPGIEPADES
jgi:multicomponent Na+:H+ antiporter subunit B